MPELLPFAGLRYRTGATDALSELVCPPYDVITPEQRQALVERSPHNIVRVELPDGDYGGAASTLSRWQAEGVLGRDEQPALYGYRMTYKTPTGATRRSTGVIGALSLEPPGHGILPHEQTTPKAKSDRLELLRAAHANTSPIWCLCSEPGLTAAVPEPPGTVATATDGDGNVHEIWPITGTGSVEAISAIAGARPLLVADGHHRYETALAYMEETGARPGDGPSAVMALVVELTPEQLEVLAIHRAVRGLPAGARVIGAFESDYDIRPASTTGPAVLDEMTAAGAVGIVDSDGVFLAAPKAGSRAAAHDLDSQRVDATLASLPEHELSYEHDVPGAFGAVAAGVLDAAVLCRPATVEQIAATARGGRRMPPKTTFFWPKPRTGMVLRAW